MTTPSKLLLLGLVCTSLPAFADWTPSSTGTYDYGSAANWAGGVINNVFLPDNYSGGAQTVTIGSDAIWNDDTGVTTSHGNGINLLLRATGGNRNLTLGGDINYVTTGSTANSFLQFGTVNNTEQINFALNDVVNINIQSQTIGRNAVIFNGVLSGSGGITKQGNGTLYLQNAASTFTGPLNLTGGTTALLGAAASLATQDIRITRQDVPYVTSGSAGSAVNGLGSSMTTLFLGNQTGTVGSSSGSAGANSNRIADDATVRLRGGTLRLLAANGNGNDLTERVGTVALDGGAGGLIVSMASTGSNLVRLDIGNLTRAQGATLVAASTNSGGSALASFGTGATAEGRITMDTINGASVTSQLVNGILPWGVQSSFTAWDLWGGDFLTYGDYGLTAYTGFVSDVNAATSTENVKVVSGTATLTASKTVNSLTLQTANLDGAGLTLTLASGALNYYSSKNDSGAGNRNVNTNLDFNGKEALIFVQRTSLQVNGIMSNTDGNGLTFTGIGTNNVSLQPSLWLNGANTYTGDTRVGGGTLYINNVSLPANSAVVINEGGAIDLRGNNVSMASLSGVGLVRFQDVAQAGTSTLTVGSNNADTEYSGQIIDASSGTIRVGNFTKVGSGKLTLSGTNAYTGTTLVSAGSLIVNGSIASSSGVSVSSGASLGGSGHVSVISGAGLVGPGNSAGILTATSVNASAGLDFAFEFSLANAAPNYASATQSGNDVLRLTAGSTPFASALNSTNTISLYLDVTSLAYGDIFTGGFYVDSGDFLSSISAATFTYYIADAAGSILYGGNRYSLYTGPFTFDVTTAQQTADFGSGDVSGYVTQFQAVPEPSTWLLVSLGLLVVMVRRRRLSI